MGGAEPTKRDIPCSCQCDTVKLGVEQQRALVRHHLVFLDLGRIDAINHRISHARQWNYRL